MDEGRASLAPRFDWLYRIAQTNLQHFYWTEILAFLGNHEQHGVTEQQGKPALSLETNTFQLSRRNSPLPIHPPSGPLWFIKLVPLHWATFGLLSCVQSCVTLSQVFSSSLDGLTRAELKYLTGDSQSEQLSASLLPWEPEVLLYAALQCSWIYFTLYWVERVGCLQQESLHLPAEHETTESWCWPAHGGQSDWMLNCNQPYNMLNKVAASSKCQQP